MGGMGLKIIDEASHSANIWVRDLHERTGWEDKQRSFRLLRAVLHALRDHLTVDEAAQLAAQLPVLIRGIYFEGWNPSRTPVKERTKEGFIAIVQKDFQTDPMGDAEHAIGAVFDVLDAHVSGGEMNHIRNSFTREMRDLFAY